MAWAASALSQPTFRCDNTLYQTIEVGGAMWLYEVETDPVALRPLANLTAKGASTRINSLALNPVDGFMYFLDVYPPYNLYRLDAAYALTNLGPVSGPAGFEYPNAGAITLDGRYIVKSVTSNRYFEVDLAARTASLLCDFSAEPSFGYLGDFAINPVDGRFYNFGGNANEMIVFDPGTCAFERRAFSGVGADGIGAVWVDAAGMGYGYANATGQLLSLDLERNEARVIGAGGATSQTDGCSCGGIEFHKTPRERTLGKGNELRFTFDLYNATGEDVSGTTFVDALPAGLAWASWRVSGTSPDLAVTRRPGAPNELNLDIDRLPPGRSRFYGYVFIPEDYPGANLPNQATLSGLPVALGGGSLPSDDPETPPINDPTVVYFFEHCGNGIDDDGDGLVDEADADCDLDCYTVPDIVNALHGLGGGFASEFYIGDLGRRRVEAIEFDPRSGKLYGADEGTWIEIDLGSGAAKVIGDFDARAQLPRGVYGALAIDDVDGLARDPVNDVWYAAARYNDDDSCDGSDVLFLVDRKSGNYVEGVFPDGDGDGAPDDYARFVLPAGLECYGFADDLGFNPYTGKLYGAFNGSTENDFEETYVMEIDPRTGRCVSQGEIRVARPDGSYIALSDVEGFTYTLDGRVLATTGDSGADEEYHNRLYELEGIGSGGTITARPLLDLYSDDYEALTCVTYADPGSASGRVYRDDDRSGDRNGGDDDVAGVRVHLINAVTGDTVATQVTDGGGKFEFDGIAPEVYTLAIDAADRSAPSGPLANHEQTEDPDATLDHATPTPFLLPGTAMKHLNFGYAPPGEICDNGIDDDGDGFVDCLDGECPGAAPVLRVTPGG